THTFRGTCISVLSEIKPRQMRFFRSCRNDFFTRELLMGMIKTTFAAAVLSALIALCSYADDPRRFTQDRFAIGMWVPPQTSEQLAQRYQEIAEANFTLVIGTAGTTAAEQLKLCERY